MSLIPGTHTHTHTKKKWRKQSKTKVIKKQEQTKKEGSRERNVRKSPELSSSHKNFRILRIRIKRARQWHIPVTPIPKEEDYKPILANLVT